MRSTVSAILDTHWCVPQHWLGHRLYSRPVYSKTFTEQWVTKQAGFQGRHGCPMLNLSMVLTSYIYNHFWAIAIESWRNWSGRRGVETRGKPLSTNYDHWAEVTGPTASEGLKLQLSGHAVIGFMCQSSCQTLVHTTKPDLPCWWGWHWLHASLASWRSPYFPSWLLSWGASPESPGMKLTVGIPFYQLTTSVLRYK